MATKKGHATTVGELREALAGIADHLQIGYRVHPIHLGREWIIDPNPVEIGVTFEVDSSGIDFAPPPRRKRAARSTDHGEPK